MKTKDIVISELVKKGYSMENGNKVWSVADRDLLYLTNDLAEGFLKVKEHPRYKEVVLNTEIQLIKENANFLIKKIKREPFNLIDLGCGDGQKAKVFVESLTTNNKIRFCPVSSNKYFVKMALKTLKGAEIKNIIDYHPIISRFSNFGQVSVEARNSKFQRNVILLLGSILASYDINEYLFNLSGTMLPGDFLIIGNGIRRGERLANIENYKHRAFDNWFSNLIKEMGINNSDSNYDARFANGRVELYYSLTKDKTIKSNEKKVELKKNDKIVVAVLYKYFEKELDKFCRKYFRDVKIFTDNQRENALVFCEK